jgi:ribonuclease P protein component
MALSRNQRIQFPVSGKLQKKVKVRPLEIKLYEGGDNRAAVIVPKSKVQKASRRNHIRRQCLGTIQQRFQDRLIGVLLVRVYTSPQSGENMPDIMNRCIDLLRC